MIIDPYRFGTPAPPFDPSDFGTVWFWLKADALTGLSDGDPVPTFLDSGPLGNDFVQASGPLQPIYKTNIKNGLPSVRFDGLGATMGCPLGVEPNQPITIFAVYKTTDSANQNIFSGYTVTSIACVFENGNQAGIYAGSATTDTNTLADWKVTAFVTNGASSSIQVNGNSPTTGNPGSLIYNGGFVLSGYTVSAFGPFNGDFMEGIAYDGLCSDIPAVMSALLSKYAI